MEFYIFFLIPLLPWVWALFKVPQIPRGILWFLLYLALWGTLSYIVGAILYQMSMSNYKPEEPVMGQGISSLFFGTLIFIIGGFVSNYFLKKKRVLIDVNTDVLDN